LRRQLKGSNVFILGIPSAITMKHVTLHMDHTESIMTDFSVLGPPWQPIQKKKKEHKEVEPQN